MRKHLVRTIASVAVVVAAIAAVTLTTIVLHRCVAATLVTCQHEAPLQPRYFLALALRAFERTEAPVTHDGYRHRFGFGTCRSRGRQGRWRASNDFHGRQGGTPDTAVAGQQCRHLPPLLATELARVDVLLACVAPPLRTHTSTHDVVVEK
jgi:hypothetical protein